MSRTWLLSLLFTATFFNGMSQYDMSHAQEISVAEDFALSADREKVLQQLIPGTETYFYFHALHYQNTEQFEKVEQLLKTWVRRHGETNSVTEIKNRQALLKYSTDPDASLKYIRERLNLRFNHQREIPQAERSLPNTLDDKLISIKTLLSRAMSYKDHVNKLEPSGLQLIANKTLNKNQLRGFLQRLQYPDIENLPQLIAKDLATRDAQQFGAYAIHRQLTLKQLEELVELRPALLNQQNYVDTYLRRLRPNDDVNWYNDKDLHRAYLIRLYEFAERLGDSHSSLKANLLFRQLELNLQSGVFDRELFGSYLRMPRQVSYINAGYLKETRRKQTLADLNQNFADRIALPPIRNDEWLVRAHLQHFLKPAKNYDEFLPWVRDNYLKKLFAETKIVNGLGDNEKWASMLTPEEYKALLERVDLDFGATNKRFHGLDEAVSIELFTKNVSNLIVKVFEINTENYYKQNRREIDTDINLDGLVANWEETNDYEEAPLRRVKRKFTFDQLNKAGVYVIDFIGNGKSSRALIRKGQLHWLLETTFAGQLFAIFDENNDPVKHAHILMAGRRYEADEAGMILIPFSTRPGRQQIVIGDDRGLSVLGHFNHRQENYQLRAGIYVDRESLVRAEMARVIIRPQLLIGGMPTPLSELTDISLNITTASHDGASATQNFGDIKLNEGQETSVEFQVPDRLGSIRFSLTAKIKNASQVQEQTLSVSDSYTINQIDKTPHISDVFLVDGDNGYRIEVRGKSGEARFRQAVLVHLKHRYFTDQVQVTLQTDEAGQVHLGKLDGIEYVKARLTSNVEQTWHLPSSDTDHYATIHASEGESIEIPMFLPGGEVATADLALFEQVQNQTIANRFEAINYKPGLLTLKGLSRGDYLLVDKHANRQLQIRVTAGEKKLTYVFGSHRKLELRGTQRAFISDIGYDDKHVTIKLGNVHGGSRVHIIATRNIPRFDSFSAFNSTGDAEPMMMIRGSKPSVYIAGRNIGDEYRYILERQYAEKFVGNMLTRPSLLLNPWAVRETQSTVHNPDGGDVFADSRAARSNRVARESAAKSKRTGNVDFSSLDFLSNPSVLYLNMKADENGVVTLEREKLGDKHFLRIIVDDHFHVSERHLKLPESKLELRDLRMVDGMDPEEHFTQSKQHSVLSEGDEFILSDPLQGKFQQFDDLGDVYRLFMAMSGDKTLGEFAFVLDWPSKSADDKRKLYSKFACHELHFFLKAKDPEFFQEVVEPYLNNKRDKTYLDHWLLGEDLDKYANGWQFDQLNTAEQILLARSLDELRASMIQHIEDRYNISPTDISGFDETFGYIFAAGGLDGKDLAGQLLVEQSKSNGRQFGETRVARPDENGESDDGRSSGRTRSLAGELLNRRSSSEGKKDKKLGEDRSEATMGKASPDSEETTLALGFQQAGGGRQGLAARKRLQTGKEELGRLFRRLKPTQEWVENNYYHLSIEQHTADRIPVNRFWRDYSNHPSGEAFLSPYFAEATSNFSEMMLALAVLDLPFEAPEHKSEITDEELKFQAGGNVIAFFQQIKPALFDRRGSTVLISENFFRNDDRYQQAGDQRFDKFVTDEFLTNVLYGGQVVITNPTSTPQTIEMLIQIPAGALPVAGSKATHSTRMNLAAFSTETAEYFFYFPSEGDYQHFPAHVSSDDRVVAVAEGQSFKVVDNPSKIDRSSWAFISQNGSEEEVIEFLENENILAVNLDRIAFRMKNNKFFNEATKVLKKRFVFRSLLWSYSIMHNDANRIREYLSRENTILRQSGSYIDTPILTINPVNRRWYEQREFWPLVNARVHRLGDRRRILNSAIYEQYHRLMDYLVARPELDSDDQLAVVYYLLLQDRVGEAIDHFEQVNAQDLDSRLQYDYCSAYLAIYQEKPSAAAKIAGAYAQHPVKRWRDLFATVISQVSEIESGTVDAVDAENQLQNQTELAAKAPSFEFDVDAGKIQLKYQNLEEVAVSYYLMDIELLFSRNPFVQQQSGGFSMIRPNTQKTISLSKDSSTQVIDIPESLDNRNVLIEISDGNRTKSKGYYANSLQIQVIEDYGQLRVTHVKSGAPQSKVYVKIYARKANGSVHFYKDGYTDLRGRFDYASISNQNLDDVTKFSMLILSEKNGAVVREANVPKE